MRVRLMIAAMVAFMTIPASAKKKNADLPDEVLRARTVYVMIAPESGISVTNPGENQSARDAVEQAFRKWGRYQVLTYAVESSAPDLIVVVVKGGTKPTVAGTDPNRRPGNVNTDDTGVNIGISTGAPPPWTNPLPNSGPGLDPGRGVQTGSAGDNFEVYLAGGRSQPLDAPPIWSYRGTNVLSPPAVRAVAEFRKTIEAVEKQRAQQKNAP